MGFFLSGLRTVFAASFGELRVSLHPFGESVRRHRFDFLKNGRLGDISCGKIEVRLYVEFTLQFKVFYKVFGMTWAWTVTDKSSVCWHRDLKKKGDSRRPFIYAADVWAKLNVEEPLAVLSVGKLSASA